LIKYSAIKHDNLNTSNSNRTLIDEERRLNMANAYLVAIYYKVIDQEKLQKYSVDALPVMMANSGKKALVIIANIIQINVVPPERAVILEFESVEAAKNAYNSEDYKAALKKLDGGADRFLFDILRSLITVKDLIYTLSPELRKLVTKTLIHCVIKPLGFVESVQMM
jgi:uncharacterized protein (DUF1330 family)